MAKIRVLVVDDSVVIRRIVTDVLASDPEIEVAGIAANGHIALDKVTQINPDLIILDVEMPEMDGLQTLAALRKTHPKLPVIMFSTLTERGGMITLDALSLGASDYVTKPANVSSATAGQERVREELIPKIKALCGRSHVAKAATVAPSANLVKPSTVRLQLTRNRLRRIEIVAIGVSTGGPNALGEILPAIPANLPVPIVIVQHMPPVFTRLLAERLNANSLVTVREGVAGEDLKPGAVWIAPGNHHMALEKTATGSRIVLQREAAEHSCRPAADVLFRSVVRIYGAATLGIILTGMGKDGVQGCELIREAGGQVLAQDEATSVVWGMPGFVASAGLADKVLPLNQIAGEIMRRTSLERNLTAASQRERALHGNL